MNLVYGSNDEIFVEDGLGINSKYINKSLEKLLQNDKTLSQLSNFEPQIWECKWFNDDNIDGYNIGDAVWINTEYEKSFIINHSDEIYDYSIKNNILKYIIYPFDQSNPQSYYLYKNIMNGFTYKQKNIKLQPLYYIGNMEDCAQIKISVKNNNKDTPDTLSSWKDFFIRDINKLSSTIEQERLSSEQYHLSCYHYSGTSFQQFKSNDIYADNSLCNISLIQRFQSHYLESDLSGFDYTIQEEYLSSSEPINMISSEISILTAYCLIDISKHGYYLIKDYEEIMSRHRSWSKQDNITWCLSNAHNFNELDLPFLIRTLPDSNFIGNINFQLTSNTEGKTYFPFSADMSYYGQIISVLNKYDITNFYIGQISSSYPTNPSEGNYNFIQDYKYRFLSVDNIKYIEKVSDDYEIRPIGQEYVDINLSGYGLISSWYRLDKSGYTEQGGCIDVSDRSSIQINLKYKYDYPISENDYYGEYSSDNDDIIGYKYGYCINITPVYDNYDYEEKIINIYNVRNNSFCIKFENAFNIRKIFYTAKGFRKV